MQGFPPAPDKTVRLDDGSSWRFPGLRWAFSHQRELCPTTTVWRGGGPPSPLPYALRDDLDDVEFTTMDGVRLTWRASLDVNHTDGVLVLHRGAIVYERYFGALDPRIPHLAMSVTKSFVGVLCATLAHEGRFDPNDPVVRHLPELAGTAYGDATIRQVMDMTVGVRFSEVYGDPGAEFWTYAAAAGVAARAPGAPDTIFEVLRGLHKNGEHGWAFAYKTCNTEVLGWILQRVADTPLGSLLSERIWRRLGAEEDAYLIVDTVGAPMCGAGLNLILRDLARFAEMMRLDGLFNGARIVPAAVVQDIRGGADREHFAKAGYGDLAGWSYRNQWWVAHDRFGAFTARGIHGQAAWIAPAAELVIVRFASHPTAANGNGPLDRVSLPSYHAIADHLSRA
jgi:CubicO group peptidase (beta-lactamase class C family)